MAKPSSQMQPWSIHALCIFSLVITVSVVLILAILYTAQWRKMMIAEEESVDTTKN